MKSKNNTGGRKGLFYNNKFLVVLSILCSIVLWVVLSLNNDEGVTRTVTVPVTINTKDSAIEKLGLQIINPGEHKVDVKIRGSRLWVGQVTADDITVSAQLSGVTQAGSKILPLKASINSTLKSFEILSLSEDFITAEFDRIIEKTLPVTTDITGVQVAENLYLETPVPESAEITIKGPEQKLSKVEKVVARAQVNETLSQTKAVEATLVLMSADGTEVDKSGFTLPSTTIQVSLPIFQTKVLPLTVGYLHEPGALDPKLTFRLSQDTIELSGPVDVMQNMASFEIGKIDYARITNSKNQFKFTLSLPSGTKTAGDVKEVTVDVDASGMRTKSVTVSNIRVLNVPEGHTASVVTSSIKGVTMIGPNAVLRGLEEGSIIAEADLTGKQATTGQLEIPVYIYDPNGRCWSYGSHTVIVKVE